MHDCMTTSTSGQRVDPNNVISGLCFVKTKTCAIFVVEKTPFCVEKKMEKIRGTNVKQMGCVNTKKAE